MLAQADGVIVSESACLDLIFQLPSPRKGHKAEVLAVGAKFKGKPLPVLFLLFLLVPATEIWLLIEVGGVIGVGWTLLTIVATALAGAALVRSQGIAIFGRIQREMATGRVPTGDMLEGLMLLLAGAVLLTPGFLTDIIGFAILIPPLRSRLSRWVLTRAALKVHRQHTATSGHTDAIDGSFRREND